MRAREVARAFRQAVPQAAPEVLRPGALINLIPRKSNGHPWNVRMREVYIMLTRFRYTQEELSLLRDEIMNARAAQQRSMDAYERTKYVQAQELELHSD